MSTQINTIHPFMALQPLPSLGQPHKMSSFISICSSSPPSFYLQQLYIPLNHIRPSSSRSSTGLVVWKFPFRTFLKSFLLPSLLYDPPILVF
jgi:hypothetical protein